MTIHDDAATTDARRARRLRLTTRLNLGSWRIATAFGLIAAGVAVLPPLTPSSAAPPLHITLSKSAPATILYGSVAPYSLNACNNTGTIYYNLGFKDVLPVGATYVVGSASPAPTAVLANKPSMNMTTLVWQNVADLQIGSCFSVSYQVKHNLNGLDNQTLHVGDTITNSANAYANNDPRYVPQFDTSGNLLAANGGVNDPSNTAVTNSKIVPVTIAKSEPSPESELMRGVHNHTTVYTLTVTNNSIKATNSNTVDDWLPAGLE